MLYKAIKILINDPKSLLGVNILILKPLFKGLNNFYLKIPVVAKKIALK